MRARTPREIGIRARWMYGVTQADQLHRSLGRTLRSQCTGMIDYARRCSEYVASHYQYLKPVTRLRALAGTIQNGRGHSGNPGPVLISLLRYEGILSRHLVAVRRDRSIHVWTDFRLGSTNGCGVPRNILNRIRNNNVHGPPHKRI